jgi:hypothetical protein
MAFVLPIQMTYRIVHYSVIWCFALYCLGNNIFKIESCKTDLCLATYVYHFCVYFCFYICKILLFCMVTITWLRFCFVFLTSLVRCWVPCRWYNVTGFCMGAVYDDYVDNSWESFAYSYYIWKYFAYSSNSWKCFPSPIVIISSVNGLLQ